MSDFVDALRDKKFLEDYIRGLKDAANRSAASFFGGPVDLATMAMRPFGYSTPDQDVTGSSEWLGRKMEERGMVSEARNPVAEFLAAVALPGGMAAAGPRLYAGEQALSSAGATAAQNAMKPSTLNRQSGMIKIPGRGQIPESRADVNKLADRFSRLLDDAGIDYTADKSNISPAKYFEFDNPKTVADEFGPERFKVRISDHRNVHGADISVDPSTGGTFEEMIASLQNLGLPIKNRASAASKEVIPDDVLEKIWGVPVSLLKDRGMYEAQKDSYKLNRKGYWERK